jgi:hypothetical protein
MNDALAVFDCNQALSRQESRELVVQMQERLLEMEQAEIVTYHCFKPGIYERTIKVPPWTVLTGAAHRTSYRVRLEKGVIAVNTDEGVKTLVGPCEFDVEAGFQRAGRVFDEEVVWTDIYANPDNCRDIDALEERLYEVPACGLGDKRQLNKGVLTCQDG